MAEVVTDPFAHVRAGDATKTGEWENPVYGVWTDNLWTWCPESDPQTSFHCSRPPGHPGKHIAAMSEQVMSVWGESGVVGREDPLADAIAGLETNNQFTHIMGWDSNEYGIRAENRDYCRMTHPDFSSSQFCTRPAGHPANWTHVSTSSYVLWKKEGVQVQVQTFEDDFPEDGSEKDPEGLVIDSVEIGELVRVRDRKNIGYVIGTRSSGKQVEILDLNNQGRLMTVALDKLVPSERKTPTVAELQMVTAWYADLRNNVRRVAVREYRRDRWCMDGLNENLAALGMARYEPTISGEIQMTIPFEADDPTLQKSDVSTELAKLDLEKIKAQIAEMFPQQLGQLTIDMASLKLTPANLRRK